MEAIDDIIRAINESPIIGKIWLFTEWLVRQAWMFFLDNKHLVIVAVLLFFAIKAYRGRRLK